jgi:hypothetical protein
LFGLGLKEMLADEITADLRRIRSDALSDARRAGRSVTRDLKVSVTTATLDYGSITAFPSGRVDTSRVEGVDDDLRVSHYHRWRHHDRDRLPHVQPRDTRWTALVQRDQDDADGV